MENQMVPMIVQNTINRLCLPLLFAVLLAVGASTWASSASADERLIGHWKSVEIKGDPNLANSIQTVRLSLNADRTYQTEVELVVQDRKKIVQKDFGAYRAESGALITISNKHKSDEVKQPYAFEDGRMLIEYFKGAVKVTLQKQKN